MPTDEKKLTVEQKMDKAFQTVQIKNQDIINDPFNASTRLISATQLDVDRFNTYETKTYGKLGFDPFKDNNEVFNRNTSSGEDLSRAFTGMIKLANVGLQDTFGFGLMAGEDNWKDFDQIMKNYSSTRGGYTQFWANTMLSSGYTVGILGAIALEEIGLAITTGGLGNLGSAGVVGTQLARGFSKLGKITESSRVLERVATLGRVKEGTKLFSLKGLGNGSLRLLKKLNPVSETMDFAYNVSKLDNLNAWQKLATGAGSIARDARKIYMTHSESRLEAELARNDFKNQKINEARMASETGVLTDADIHRIGVDGDRVYAGTYSKNLGLIYVTNAITFDNMFKSMRYNNKMFLSGGSRFKTTLGKAGLVVKAVANTTVKGTAKAAWKGIANFSVSGSAKAATTFVKANWKAKGKSLLGKAIKNSMEGVQEVGQDVISNSVKSYVGRNHTGSQARGGFLEYMWNDVGAATKDLATKRDEQGNLTYEGLSTFGSGFFMGAFAAPFGAGISYFQKQVVGGGAKAKAEYLFSRKSYVAKQKTQYRKALAKATVLTEIFNQNLGSYLETTTLPFIAQTELQEDILTAAKNNDKKGFEDKKEESFQNGIKTMLKNNTESEFTDFLEDMVNNYTVQEMNQAMGRTDITKENVAEYKEKLSKKSKSIKSYRAKYNEINELIVDPIMQSDIDRLDIKDPVQREEKLRLMINKRAISNLKDELLFNNGKIANKAQRMGALQEQIHRETKLSTTEVQALISKKGLASEIKLLAAQVAGNKGLNLQGADLEAANIAKAKLETFTEYQKAVAKVEEIESNEDSTVDEIESAYSTMFEAYHKLRTLDSEFGIGEPEEVKRAISRKSFNAITDYLDLSSESDVLQAAVNTLLDPESASMWLEKNSEMMLDIDKNKETHIANQLIAFAEKAESSTMLINLQQEGLFFDLNELDDLVDKGIMPSVIYNIATNKPASKEEYQKAQDIISQFYKRLTGKTITQDKSTTKKTSARSKKDKRTAKTLVREYGIKLDKEIDLSDPVQLERLIEKLKASKQLTFIEKELLDAVKDSMPKIMFTESGELPISVNEKGVFVIDIRYASADYKNAKVSFETLVLSALTQSKLNASLEQDAELKKEVEDLMTQARDAFAKKYPNQGAEEMSVFNNTDEFLSEALNNTSFQGFLGSVNDTVSGEKESLWKTLMAKLMLVFNKTFDKSILQRAVSLANMAFDESVVENIDEKAEVTDDTPAVEQEVGDLESVSSEDIEEFTISEVVPGVFQVTGDGNVVAFDTKAEADAYVKEKTGPIKKTVKQTVKQTVKRTIELGNTISIENARDRPDLFGDYLFPEVVAGDLLLAAEWAKKAEELGKELDDAGVTDWKYGEIRVDIDGRLVIDVSAEIPTYELRKKATKAANAKIQQLQDELKAIEKNIADLNISTNNAGTTTGTKANVDISEGEAVSVSTPRKLFKDRLGRIKENQEGKRKAKHYASAEGYVVSLMADRFNENDDQGRTIYAGAEVYLNKEEISEIKRIEAKRDNGMINASQKDEALQQVYRDVFKRALATYEIVEDAEFETEVKDRRSKYNANTKADIENERAAELKSKGVDRFFPEEINETAKQIEERERKQKIQDEINERYDSKLAALKGAQNNTGTDIEINPLVAELEAKKRDVEKQLKNEPEYSESEVEEKVQSGTKTVNFLMYKSTGTGSTAKSLGEWVPLLGFGLHPNKDEWFIKAYSNGVDPKLNKYGSSTFAAIDKDLKKNEAGLFTGARRTEEIEEEVDVEVDVEIEVPRDRAAREEEIRVDEEAQLKDEINKKRELLNTIDRQLASTSKLQFRKRINLDTQRKRLLIDLKDLQEKHDELSLQANKNVVLDPAVSQTTDVDAGEETQDNVDLDNKTIVTEKTSFSLLPEDLQDLLLEQFRSSVTQNSINDIRSVFSDLIKDLETLVVTTDMTDEEIKESDDILLEKLEKFNRVIGKKYNAKINAQSKVEISPAIDNSFATTDEQDAIQKLMGVDIAYIKTIIDYNKSVEPVEFVPAPIPEPTVELDDVSLARLNAEAMERAKQLTQERINREAEEARERRKARLSAKVPITEMERSDLTELLKRVLKLDFDILSEADVIMLIDNLIDSDINNSFKIPDVIAFVNKKKLDIKKQSEIDFIELAFAEELAKKESEAARKKALASYQKDLFEEFDNARVAANFASLKKSINNGDSFFINYNGKDVKFSITKMELAAFALYNKDILKSDNIKEILVEIYKTMRSVNATAKGYSKYSLPKENAEDELIKTFFRLKDSGFLYPSVVKAINTALYRDGVKLTIVKSNSLSGSLYTIEARGMVAKKGPQNNLAVAKQIVRDYTENANPEDDLWREAMVASWFSVPENRVNPQMITNDMSRGEEKIYKNFTSPKSKYKKMDALGEIIFADFLDEVEEYYNRGIGGVGDDVLTAFSHNSISQFIFDVADKIKKQNGVEDMSDLEGFEEYINSKLADESSVLNEEYYNSLEFKIENGLIDASSFDFSTLTPSQQRLYDQAVDNGLYDSKPNLEGVVNTEDVVVEESSPFIIPVVEETAISKEGSALRKELNNLNTFEAQAHIKAVLNSSENFNNLKLFLAIHQIVNGERAQFTDEQKNIINDQIIRKLDQGFFAGMSIMNEGIPMQIVSYNKKDKTVELVDVSTGETKTISYNDFLNTTEVFEEGAEYNALNVDTVVNDQEIAYIKDAYQDIFNNFTQSVAEFEKLEESELNNKILEQLTKCK
jgi:hypothetical protein